MKQIFTYIVSLDWDKLIQIHYYSEKYTILCKSFENTTLNNIKIIYTSTIADANNIAQIFLTSEIEDNLHLATINLEILAAGYMHGSYGKCVIPHTCMYLEYMWIWL